MKPSRIVLIATPALIGILATALSLFDSQVWWVRIWDFPRLQVLCWCLFSIALLGIFLRPFGKVGVLLTTAVAASALYQGSRILPYTPVYPVEVLEAERQESGETLRIMTANVLTSNRNAKPLLEIVEAEHPDILLLTEPDTWWVEQLAALDEGYPHQILHPLDNTYGIALYSRLPLKDPKVEFLVESDIPSVNALLVLSSGKQVKFFGIHPKPPAPAESEDTTERDAELVIVGKKMRDLKIPAIVAGDLNDVAWSSTTSLFQKISGTLDPRRGRGMYNTFHANIPVLRFPLDHIFHTEHFRLSALRRLSGVGSDHFPILIELSLEESAEVLQEEPQPRASDVIEGEELIEKAKQERREEKESQD